MRKQFDSCSYEELTNCVHARIRWIREMKKFLKDENTKDYGHIKAKCRLSIATDKKEISKLLKMRRVLKKSNLKNWDSDILSVK